MAIAPVRPIVLKDVDLLIALDPDGTGTVDPATDTDYGGHTSNVTLTPTSSTVTWNGLKPEASHSEAGAENWTADLTLAQDWSDTGLARFLYENAGKRAVMRFTPEKSTGLPSFDVKATLVSPAIGGAVDAVAESTVSLGVSGRPAMIES